MARPSARTRREPSTAAGRYAALERLGKRHGDLDRRVGIVALPDIQQPGDAADVAQFSCRRTELAAGQGQDHAVLGHFFDKLGVIVAARFGAVAAAHQEEMPDGLALHRLDDLVGHTHDRVSAEPDHDALTLDVRGKSRHCERLFDHRREILGRMWSPPAIRPVPW